MSNPEKYNWEPRWLLSHLIDLYLHLDSDMLAEALAKDQRSFSMDTFEVRREMETMNSGKRRPALVTLKRQT